jgi:hypothetical protein
MSAGSPAPCCLPRAAPYRPDPVEKPGSQIGYVWRPGSVSGACLAVRCFAGFLVKTAPARATRYANDDRKPWAPGRPGRTAHRAADHDPQGVTGSDASRHPEAVSTGRAFRSAEPGYAGPVRFAIGLVPGWLPTGCRLRLGPGLAETRPCSRSSLSTRLLSHAPSDLVRRGDVSGLQESTRLVRFSENGIRQLSVLEEVPCPLPV